MYKFILKLLVWRARMRWETLRTWYLIRIKRVSIGRGTATNMTPFPTGPCQMLCGKEGTECWWVPGFTWLAGTGRLFLCDEHWKALH